MNIRAYIDYMDFFSGVSDSAKEQLADICIPKKVEKKQVLFQEGEQGNAFYLVGGGSIGLYKGMGEGKDVVIKIAGRGDVFAEVIIFEQDTYPVTAVALQPSQLFIVPKIQFICLLADERFRNDFIRLLMRKQRYLAERIKYLTMHDVEERFFLFIEKNYDISGDIRLSIPKKDIAAAIGTTPETYSRLITRLQREGKLRIIGKTIRFLER